LAKRPKLGEMLVEENILSKAHLQQALAEKEDYNLKLGEFLVHKNYVHEKDMIETLSKQLKIDKFSPENYPLDYSLTEIIPFETAKKYKTIPLKKENSILLIAMTDPLDINACDNIELQANLEVEPVVCSESEFKNLLSSLYGESDLSVLLEDIEPDSQDTDVREQRSSDIQVTDQVEVSSLQDMAEEAPVIRLVNSILAQAVHDKASDIHISPEKDHIQVKFRRDGKLQDAPAPPKSMFLPVISRIKILAHMDIATSRIPQDGRFTVNMEGKEINVRASTMPTIHGENMVLRLLDMSAGIFNLNQLGMYQNDREKLASVSNKPYGMIISTGPTGSGKSTSLYSIIESIKSPELNIVTLEDPVEYRVDGIRQVQLNSRAGMTFASGLRSILRQDPDIVMVGEIRDYETANIAVQASLTGHRLLSTLHTNDAAGAITRLLDMGIEPFLISSSLLVTFAQRLVRRVCPYCAQSYTPDEKMLQHWGLENASNAKFQKGMGCYQCHGTGYKGRIGVFEILLNDEMVQDMIMQKATSREIARKAKNDGRLKTLKQDAAKKVLQGYTTLEEATATILV